MEIIKTHCKICNCRCGILVHVEKGHILKIEGDKGCLKNNGALCIKGRAMLEFIYDEDRLKYPMKRKGRKWQRVDWDDALGYISDKLNVIKSRYGAEAVAFYRGMSVYSWLTSTYFKRLANVYGSPNFFSNAALCVSSKIIANRFTFGPGLSTSGDFRNSKCILLLGTNPAVTGMHRTLSIWTDIRRAQKDGAKLIVIDPKRTETARKADIHTTIRPGTDCAFVLSLIHVIIKNNWVDDLFVAQHTQGFGRLKDLVRAYSPEQVEKTSWVKAQTIREIAEIFATSKPACADRREGVLHHPNGTQACRAINILNTITGNIDIKGGLIIGKTLYSPASPLFKELSLQNDFASKAASISSYNRVTTDIPVDIVKSILDEKPYPLRGLLVVGSNPVIGWPNTTAVEKALKKLDLLVLIDVYRNDTSSFADIVLPAATFMEKIDFQSPEIGVPKIIQLQQPAIKPLWESKSEFWIFKRLAEKMGYGQYFQDTEKELIDKILAKWGLSFESLTQNQNESGFEFEPASLGSFRKKGFSTESKKITIFSRTLQDLGFDALPGLVINPENSEKYPLHLITGHRIRTAYLSYLHNLPSLHKKTPRNWVEIHPDTAKCRGIQDGDRVTVESPKGAITLEVKINDRVDPRVVMIPYGWGHRYQASWQLANSDPGENVNFLTDHKLTDKISGMPNYKSNICEIKKCA